MQRALESCSPGDFARVKEGSFRKVLQMNDAIQSRLKIPMRHETHHLLDTHVHEGEEEN